MSDLHWLTISELGTRFRSKDLSPVEVTEAYLHRIETIDGELESFQLVLAESALDDARAAEAAIQSGQYRGPLHGVPIAVKDLCDMAGHPTLAGTIVRRGDVARHDSTVVRRLRDAGAVIVGKLAMTEGAMAGYHPDMPVPVNPWDPTRWAGVSSSGSGAATAAGLCAASLGSDTGGSIRFPAAACGIVGLKPTYGRVSRAGVFPLAESLDHVGPLARSSRDAGLVLGAIAGADDDDPTTLLASVDDCTDGIDGGVAGLRIGFDEAFAADGADEATVAAVRAALDVLVDAGAVVVPVTMPTLDEFPWVALASAEAALAHRDTFPSRADEYGGFFAMFLSTGHSITGAMYAAANDERGRYAGRLGRVFAGVDVIATPTVAHAAFAIDRAALRGSAEEVAGGSQISTRFTGPYNLTGNPSIALPAGFDADGLPLSVQFGGRHLDEALLCRLGHTFEQATDWHRHHPPL